MLILPPDWAFVKDEFVSACAGGDDQFFYKKQLQFWEQYGMMWVACSQNREQSALEDVGNGKDPAGIPAFGRIFPHIPTFLGGRGDKLTYYDNKMASNGHGNKKIW